MLCLLGLSILMSLMSTLYDSKVHLVKNHGDSVSQVNMHKTLIDI
jgi:hypothetical protein